MKGVRNWLGWGVLRSELRTVLCCSLLGWIVQSFIISHRRWTNMNMVYTNNETNNGKDRLSHETMNTHRSLDILLWKLDNLEQNLAPNYGWIMTYLQCMHCFRTDWSNSLSQVLLLIQKLLDEKKHSRKNELTWKASLKGMEVYIPVGEVLRHRRN